MKWYIEYLIIYVIVFLIYLAWFTPQMSTFEGRIIVSLIMSLILGSVAYLGYRMGKKPKKKKK